MAFAAAFVGVVQGEPLCAGEGWQRLLEMISCCLQTPSLLRGGNNSFQQALSGRAADAEQAPG